MYDMSLHNMRQTSHPHPCRPHPRSPLSTLTRYAQVSSPSPPHLPPTTFSPSPLSPAMLRSRSEAEKEMWEPLSPWCMIRADVKKFSRRVNPDALYALAELFLLNGDMSAWLYTGVHSPCVRLCFVLLGNCCFCSHADGGGPLVPAHISPRWLLCFVLILHHHDLFQRLCTAIWAMLTLFEEKTGDKERFLGPEGHPAIANLVMANDSSGLTITS